MLYFHFCSLHAIFAWENHCRALHVTVLLGNCDVTIYQNDEKRGPANLRQPSNQVYLLTSSAEDYENLISKLNPDDASKVKY